MSRMTTTGLGRLRARLQAGAKVAGSAATGRSVRNVLSQHAAGLGRIYSTVVHSGQYPHDPLTSRYATRKRAAVGRATPVLVATGRLTRGIRVTLKRQRKGVYKFRLVFRGQTRRGRPYGVIGAAHLARGRNFSGLPRGWQRGVISSVRAVVWAAVRGNDKK